MNAPIRERRKTLVVLSQVYVPDPASVGQHVADVASAMAKRGWRVIVLTSARGYDDPTRVYAARELLDGVEVRRLPLSSMGKRSIAIRLVGGMLFLVQAVARALCMRSLDLVLVSTSPPMAPGAGAFLSWARGVPVRYWVMDLNPDQMIAAGKVRARSAPARMFDWMNRRILSRAADVVVLDRFMAARVQRKLDVRGKLSVIPPWPHEEHLGDVRHENNPFREEHQLGDRRVVMYSGNHSPANPLTTLLEAAKRLRDDPRLVFLFVGGGTAKRDVEMAAVDAPNVRSLPYQPIERLAWSLSAGDVHVVTMGDDMVGIIHPCKVYGAMAVGRPILFVGPPTCHVSDLMDRADIGWRVSHGDVDGAVRVLCEIAGTTPAVLTAKAARARALLEQELSKSILCGQFCDVLEYGGATNGRGSVIESARPAVGSARQLVQV